MHKKNTDCTVGTLHIHTTGKNNRLTDKDNAGIS